VSIPFPVIVYLTSRRPHLIAIKSEYAGFHRLSEYFKTINSLARAHPLGHRGRWSGEATVERLSTTFVTSLVAVQCKSGSEFARA
jgi:hypothetical protein